MENKCNKTPNTNIKYMDHVYCQANEGKNYMRANHSSSGGGSGSGTMATNSDFLALLKENKQLKAMLILHLDLIQEQSDQLTAKDKQLASQREHIEAMRTKSTQLESQVQELQKQLQRQIKRVVTAVGEISSLPPPPLAKIQSKVEHSSVSNVIGESNGKIINKILLHRVNQQVKRENPRSPLSHISKETTVNSEGEGKTAIKNEIEDKTREANKLDKTSTERNNDEVEPKQEIKEEMLPLLGLDDKSKDSITINSSSSPANATQICVTPPTPSRGKQMPLMLWHATSVHSDESDSCDSMLEDDDQFSTSAASPAQEKSADDCKNSISEVCEISYQKSQRCPFISTSQMYSTREWEDEEIICDYEFTKEEADALHADAPMLEIPKWTEHDLTMSNCIDGTEDLADETFSKRHTKLEVDERRRKKWDVQQIREQRRIEKLKRRHCKEEVSSSSDQSTVTSFYPPADRIQTICYVNDLPVQAFGEMIPKLSTTADFVLPWMEKSFVPEQGIVIPSTSTASAELSSSPSAETATNTNASSVANQLDQSVSQSTFILVKKRKRQQSGSGGSTLIKQKCVSSAKTTLTSAASLSSPTSDIPTTEELFK